MHIFTLSAVLSLLAVPCLATEVADILYEGVVIAESTSVEGYLDAPKLNTTTANETSYDWYE